jgi:hypothetical protein
MQPCKSASIGATNCQLSDFLFESYSTGPKSKWDIKVLDINESYLVGLTDINRREHPRRLRLIYKLSTKFHVLPLEEHNICPL